MQGVGAKLRGHWPLLAVLGVALAVRALFAAAWSPALLFSDSWAYIDLAFGPDHFAPDRPSGYPALLALIGAAAKSLAAITTVQHLAGLATGVVAYALLLRLGAGRLLATLAAALILLDAYAITLEQTILAESFFTLALLGSFALVAGRDRGGIALVASGLLLAAAGTMRTAGLFAVPVWLAYAFYRHRLRAVPALAALVVPLLAYAVVYESRTGELGLTASDGWFLYGRVGEIADCSKFDPPAGTGDLCEPVERSAGRAALYYIWDPASPANRRFGSIYEPGSSDPLRRFSLAVIRQRPAEYARIVARDLGRYFRPGTGSRGRSDAAIEPPADPRTGPPWMNEQLREAHFPGFEPEVHAGAGLARAYHSVVHVPRPLLAALALAALALLPLSLLRRLRPWPRGRAEALLLAGGALAIVAGATASAGFIVRYLVAVAPLLVCGGALALGLLVPRLARQRQRVPGGHEQERDGARHDDHRGALEEDVGDQQDHAGDREREERQARDRQPV